MIFSAARAAELLHLGTADPAAEFRNGQEEAIRHVVEGRGRLLVVQRTGWGKSSVYFIATKLLREQGAGPALLISPLLSLMRNQIAAAQRMEVRALTIHSENLDEWNEVEAALASDEVDILLISPERLANDRFQAQVLAALAPRLSLLVVDEAHCISDWGHDFRPHYRLLERFLRKLPPAVRLLATTATANDRVQTDLAAVLGPGLTVSRGPLHRPSLFLQTLRLASQPERLAWLAAQVPALPGSGIIYTLTVRDAVQVADWLRSRGIVAEAYTGESGDRRAELEEALLANRVKALVATPALGMGFDKPDLAFVIHFQTPGSVVAYYQQVGRAGRGLPAAYGVLLSGAEDTDITDYFIETAFPSREDARQVLDALREEPRGLSVPELLGAVNISFGRVEKTLLLLSLESTAPLAKSGTKWRLTTDDLSDSFWERAERLTDLRRVEQRQMQEYVKLREGHMEFLIRALDGDVDQVVTPDLAPLPATVDTALVGAAVTFLRGASLDIAPRKRWPAGGLPMLKASGNIAANRQALPGKALGLWGDAGWGALVRVGKAEGAFSDELVAACTELVFGWGPVPRPAWVTSVPSFRHRELMPDFARRLAAGLGLPFRAALEMAEERPPQREMANSFQKARNLEGSLRLAAAPLPEGPVLLVDDLVDSRWTLTVAAWLLTGRGRGPVLPLALATTGFSG